MDTLFVSAAPWRQREKFSPCRYVYIGTRRRTMELRRRRRFAPTRQKYADCGLAGLWTTIR